MKTILITGVSRGIGKATCQRFLEHGWRVVGTYNATPIDYAHANLLPIEYNQQSSESIRSLVDRVVRDNISLDAVVHNAAVMLDPTTVEVSQDVLRKTFEVNVYGLVDLNERLLPILTHGGRVVNIASLYGTFHFPIDSACATAYRMSKAALNMYTRSTAYKHKDGGVVIVSFDPGWVKTDMGNLGASEDEGPDRTPEEVGAELYELVMRPELPTGTFWHKSQQSEW